MHEWQSLSQVRWECKYHVVMIPKSRRTVFDGKLGRPIGTLLREWCRPRGVELVEGHAMPDPIHRCLSIPPKSSVAFPIGFLNGKSAVRIHRELVHERRMRGLPFGAAGSGVSTVGLDEARVRQSIREQEEWERRQGELDLEEPVRPRQGLPETKPPTGATTRRRPPRGGLLNTTASGRGFLLRI